MDIKIIFLGTTNQGELVMRGGISPNDPKVLVAINKLSDKLKFYACPNKQIDIGKGYFVEFAYDLPTRKFSSEQTRVNVCCLDVSSEILKMVSEL